MTVYKFVNKNTTFQFQLFWVVNLMFSHFRVKNVCTEVILVSYFCGYDEFTKYLCLCICCSKCQPYMSIINGYNEERKVKNITFEGLKINGRLIYDDMPGKPRWYQTADFVPIYIGNHVEGVTFKKQSRNSQEFRLLDASVKYVQYNGFSKSFQIYILFLSL